MTSEHIFLKSQQAEDGCWYVVPLKENDLIKTHRGLVLNPRTPDIKFILYEKEEGMNAKVIGIKCKEMIWI
jgi:hypothetical protein